MAGNKSFGRNVIMDAMRGIASMWVVVFHFNEVIPFAPNFWQKFCKIGWLGVPVFFVISGWCMAMIIKRENSPWAFLTKRFMRIYPPYWLSLLIVVAVAVLRRLWAGANDVTPLPGTPASLLATVTLLTRPATHFPAINWVYWSLTYEVMFYLLVAAGLLWRKPVFFLGLILPLCLFRTTYAHNNSLGGLLFFADQYPLFILGFFACRGKLNFRDAGLPGLTAALCFGVSGRLSAFVALIAAGLLLWSECGSKIPVGWLRPLAKIGDWSYSLYLIHVPIGCYLLLRFRSQMFLDNTGLHIIYDLTALAICIACAWLIHVTVEQPSHRFGQFLAAKFQSKTGALDGHSVKPTA